jgi:hypothetical protein
MHCLIEPAAGEPTPDWLDPLLARAAEIPEAFIDPLDPHTPAERLLGRLAGLPADAALPLAAWQVAEPGERGPWVLLSPVHLQIETNQVVALPQSVMGLDAVTGTALFQTLGELFPEADGWQRRMLSPLTWALSHEQLAGLRLASLGRAVNRPLTPWLPDDKRIRRWTNEVQMLWHGRPAMNGLTPNSVWWWGAGEAPVAAPELRRYAGFPPAEPEGISLLSLAGDEKLRSFRLGGRRWWQRRGAAAAEVLASL